MADVQADLIHTLMLDGNAAAGLLETIFAVEMTASPTECAGCGREGDVGTLLAFTQSPGVVLRCPACWNIVLRIVGTPDAFICPTGGDGAQRRGQEMPASCSGRDGGPPPIPRWFS